MAGASSPRNRCWPRSARRWRSAPGRPARPRTGHGDRPGRRSPWSVVAELGREKSTRGTQYRVRPAQLGVLALQLADPGRIPARGPRPLPGIDLSLLDPAAERVAVDSQLLTDPPACRGDAARLLLDVEDQADRPLPHLIRILLRCWHDSTLSWVRSLYQSRGDSVSKIRCHRGLG